MARRHKSSMVPCQYSKEDAIIAKVKEILENRDYFGPASILLSLCCLMPNNELSNYDQYFNFGRGLERELLEHHGMTMVHELEKVENQEGLVIGRECFLISSRQIRPSGRTLIRMHTVIWLPEMEAGYEQREAIAIEFDQNFEVFIKLIFPSL